MPASGATMGRITLEFSIANYRDVVSAEQGLLAPEAIRRVTLRGSSTPARRGSCCPNPPSINSA